ncbi:neogenin-like [Haliotis rufescens]|uniref:neogenin-like n=1 Tax=Haliotis rufescens TaxID=6454 RepID=UPI00201EBA92|nr:neogenin-like [Haliotis rufescens]
MMQAVSLIAVLMVLLGNSDQVVGRKKNRNLPLTVEKYPNCKYYKKGHVGVCDLATNTQVKTLALKKGGDSCPQTKNITESCNSMKCKYRFAGWGSCNKADNTRVKLFKLRAGQPETCPTEKRKFRQCKTPSKKNVDCRYKKGPWSECDSLTQVKTRSLTLKKGDRSECQNVKMVMKKCLPTNKFGSKSNGLPISEATLNDSTESVFSLRLPEPPSQPQVMESDVTDTSVKMTWQPGPRAQQDKLLGYIIEYFSITGQKHVWVTASKEITQNSYTVQNLQPGTSYMFQVRAENEIGISQASPPSDTIRTHNKVYSAPSRPTHLRLRPSSNSVVVDWAPPPASDLVDGYILSYGKGIPDTHSTVVDKHQMSYTMHQLEPNTEYVVKLVGFNKIGVGQPLYDAVKTLKTWSRNSVLTPPVGLQGSAQSESSIVVAWSDVNQKAGVQLPDNYLYKVRYSHKQDEYQYMNTSHTSVQIHGLQPFTDYEVSVRVMDGREYSTWSMSSLVRTHASAPTTPPTDLTVLSDRPDSIAINWQPPTRANGVITGYAVLYTTNKTRDNDEWTAMQVGGEDLSTRLNSVKPEQTYYFKVQARNRKGYGPFSNIVAFTTSAAAPGTAPADVTVTAGDDKGDTALISWQPPIIPNGIITGYLIYYSTDDTKPEREWVLEGMVGHTLSTTIADLTPCTKYFFKMQARNKEGYGPLSRSTMIRTSGTGDVICSPETRDVDNKLPPVGLKARKITAESALLTWKDTHKKGTKDKDVVYIARYKSVKPSLDAHFKNLTVHDPFVVIMGLEANTEYEMSVMSIRYGVSSPWSMTLAVKTKEAVPGGPPEDVTMTAVSDNNHGTVIVTWQPPAKTNGLITGYLVFYTATEDAETGDWVMEEVGGDRLSVVIKDLTPDTRYYVKVQAQNRKGFGQMSKVVVYTVSDAACTEPGCSRPTNPCRNSPCPRGTTCVTMETDDARYVCVCSDGKMRTDCTMGDGLL